MIPSFREGILSSLIITAALLTMYVQIQEPALVVVLVRHAALPRPHALKNYAATVSVTLANAIPVFRIVVY